MIKINYKKSNKEFCIQVEGHSGYAPRGKDIVCAGVSTLTQTLLAYLIKNKMDTVYVIDDGQLYITSKDRRAMVVFDATIIGLEMLAEEYPQNVSIRGAL